MKRIFRCIAAFLFLLYILFLQGRAESANASVYHNLRNYTVDDGLSSNHVYGIVQDSIGFIWFGTDNGLCRFDGCEFRSYTHTAAGRSGSHLITAWTFTHPRPTVSDISMSELPTEHALRDRRPKSLRTGKVKFGLRLSIRGFFAVIL